MQCKDVTLVDGMLGDRMNQPVYQPATQISACKVTLAECAEYELFAHPPFARFCFAIQRRGLLSHRRTLQNRNEKRKNDSDEFTTSTISYGVIVH